MNETKAIKNISKNKPKSQNSLIKYCSTKYILIRTDFGCR